MMLPSPTVIFDSSFVQMSRAPDFMTTRFPIKMFETYPSKLTSGAICAPSPNDTEDAAIVLFAKENNFLTLENKSFISI
jgi:hypothetical protein